MPERPATEEELIAKFRGLATPVVGEAQAEALLDMVLNGQMEGVRGLMALTMPDEGAEMLKQREV
jgi:hypothetical protein